MSQWHKLRHISLNLQARQGQGWPGGWGKGGWKATTMDLACSKPPSGNARIDTKRSMRVRRNPQLFLVVVVVGSQGLFVYIQPFVVIIFACECLPVAHLALLRRPRTPPIHLLYCEARNLSFCGQGSEEYRHWGLCPSICSTARPFKMYLHRISTQMALCKKVSTPVVLDRCGGGARVVWGFGAISNRDHSKKICRNE